MSSIFPGLGEKAAAESEAAPAYKENTLVLTYRHWFVISLLVLFNVVIFGCIFLVAMGKIHWGG
ncbi:MAG: hypothetical protein WCF84_23785 [Anaerolineae bacterium]